jgi:uncharacterized membrane protein YgdD (TMEM256/DUF423 family)
MDQREEVEAGLCCFDIGVFKCGSLVEEWKLRSRRASSQHGPRYRMARTCQIVVLASCEELRQSVHRCSHVHYRVLGGCVFSWSLWILKRAKMRTASGSRQIDKPAEFHAVYSYLFESGRVFSLNSCQYALVVAF